MLRHIINNKYIATHQSFAMTLLLWLLGIGFAHAQTVVIKGKVIDDEKAPIELAQVRVEGTGCGAVCNLKGEFRFTCESADSMVVVFSMLGYETRKRVLENPVDSVTLNVMLPSSSINTNPVQCSRWDSGMAGSCIAPRSISRPILSLPIIAHNEQLYNVIPSLILPYLASNVFAYGLSFALISFVSSI